jgi:hypothetical protein
MLFVSASGIGTERRVTRTGLSTLLNNSFYIGLIRIRKTGELFQGAHEPIVSTPLFNRVKAVLREKQTCAPTGMRFSSGVWCGASTAASRRSENPRRAMPTIAATRRIAL